MKKIIIILISVALGGTALYFLIGNSNQNNLSVNIAPFHRSESEVVNQAADNMDLKVYTSGKYGFSFKYSKDFTVGELEEGDGDTVVIQNHGISNSGVQIFIIPFDEAGPITAERIKQDLSDIKIKSQSRVMLGGSVDALAFFSKHPDFGNTVEVWFIYDGYLYQVLTYVENKELLERILSTFKFDK